MYWTPKKLKENEVPEQFWEDCVKVLDIALGKGIHIADGMGKEEYETGRDIINSTTMTDEGYPSIVFNGPEELQEDYETFVLCFDGEWSFCKTGEMPYDVPLKCILMLADKYKLLNEWDFDGDYENDIGYIEAHDILVGAGLL